MSNNQEFCILNNRGKLGLYNKIWTLNQSCELDRKNRKYLRWNTVCVLLNLRNHFWICFSFYYTIYVFVVFIAKISRPKNAKKMARISKRVKCGAHKGKTKTFSVWFATN